MEEFSPFISVSGGESSGGTTNPSDIQNVNQDADETVNSAVGAIVDEQRAAKRKSSSPGLETNVPPKKLQSPKTQSVACVASCHKHATSVFDEKLGSGANLSNTRTFDRELKGWFKARVPADREANKAWICSACVAYGKAVLGGTSEEELSKHAEERHVNFILKKIRDKTLTESSLLLLVESIAIACQAEIDVFGRRNRPTHKHLIESYDNAWNENGLKLLKRFVETASGFITTKFTEKKRGLRHMQKSVENLCLVSHPRFISSTAAAESLVLHAFTGSRAACDVYSRSNASGGHTHMTNLIDSIATVSPEFPTGDIFVAFDNQQVIGREYRVSAGGRQRISVATTISVFQEALPVNVQSKFPLNTKLPIPSSDPAALWSIFSKEEDKWKAVHRSYRNKWIEKRLEIVKSEIALGNGDLQNSSIQTHIRSAEYESGLEYSRVPAGSSSCAAVDMESLLVNPNSTATVTQVLDKLLELNERSDPNRKWFSVYCDGLPYGIAWKLIQFTYICSACKKTGSEAELRVHECGFNLCTRKYAKFNLQFGAGHGEINLVRTVFKENFGIFIRPIAQKLGFVSPKSLEYCKSAHDHHKSWQILQIIYVALSDEIMNLYNKDNPNTDFSVSSFSEWKQKQTNPNLSLAFDFVFNVLHPIFLFRAAIRQCNDNVAYSALYQASSLFFGFNHPKYRDIIAKQIFMGICSPSEGSPTSRKLAFRMNGSQFGQGLDFLLEERNKAQKNWVFSHGPPTHNQWKRASSSLSYFESIGEQVKDNLEWSIDNNNRWRQKFGDEYILARQHFREILSELPPTLHAFTKEREPLNPKFVNSMAICAENKITYLKAFISGKKCVLNVVSAEDMHAKSSEELKKLAKRQLRQLPASTKADLESQLSKAVDVDDILEIIGSIEYLVEELDSPITTF